MTDDNPQPRPHSPVASPSEQELLCEYGDDLSTLKLNDEEAQAFLAALWKIMVIFADLGFDLGPVPAKDEDNAPDNFARLRIDVLSLLDLEEPAPETPASPKNQTKEEPT